jgi:hypothetical protein
MVKFLREPVDITQEINRAAPGRTNIAPVNELISSDVKVYVAIVLCLSSPDVISNAVFVSHDVEEVVEAPGNYFFIRVNLF